MNIVGEKDFLDLSRDRPNMFDLGFSDNSCHHLWRLSSMSLYIFVPSRSQYFFLITIFFLSLLFSGCDVSGQQLGTRDGQSEPEPERGRPTNRREIRCTAVQFPYCTECCTVHVLCTGELRSEFFMPIHLTQVSEQILRISVSHLWACSPLKHNLAAGSGQSLN